MAYDIRFRPLALLLTAVAIAAAPSLGRAQTRVNGEWIVRYERAVRSMHESEVHIVNDSAKMTLWVRGDSVFGYWQPTSDPGEAPANPSSVRGTLHRDSIHVQVIPVPTDDGFFVELGRDIVQFLKTYVHNMPPMTTHVEVVAHGDSLIGIRRAVSADGSKQVLPRPLIATRATR